MFTLLSSKAVRGPLHARGTLMLNKERIYGFVECTRDLSATNCKKCLDIAIKELIDRAYKMRGGHAIFGSCYIRFEFYIFYPDPDPLPSLFSTGPYQSLIMAIQNRSEG